jgi:hypothetical protein
MPRQAQHDNIKIAIITFLFALPIFTIDRFCFKKSETDIDKFDLGADESVSDKLLATSVTVGYSHYMSHSHVFLIKSGRATN